MITDFIKYIPMSLRDKSGTVFYSGRSAFNVPGKLYILGLNPGGSPQKQAKETIEWHTDKILHEKPDDWSEYQDEQWLGKPAGSHGLQPRILHLLHSLNLNPRRIPASNLIFLRSIKENDLDFEKLATECWPFHEQVIHQLDIKAVLCFGKTTGNWVRRKMLANKLVDEFVERNDRKWRNSVYENHDGFSVVIATHPSRVNWRNPATDPTPLLESSLKRVAVRDLLEQTESGGF